MVPVYVTPFEYISARQEKEDNPELRKILGVDFPHPMAKFRSQETLNISE